MYIYKYAHTYIHKKHVHKTYIINTYNKMLTEL